MSAVKDKSLLSLSWPLIITFGIGMSLPMMDSWFLSRSSMAAAAGVGALMPILGTLFMALHAFSQAGASIAAQFMGGGRSRHARATQTLVITGSVLLGAVVGIALWPLAPALVGLMGLKGETAVAGTQFLQAIAPAFVFRALQSSLTSLIASHGRTVWNLGANILTVFVNASLNIVFLNGYFGLPHLGVYGVAMATGISWAISTLALWIILVWDLEHRTHLRDLKRGYQVLLPDWLRIGIPAAVEPVSFQAFQVFITALFVRLGDAAMASRVFAGNFALFAVIFSVGLGSGSQILVGHLVGSKEYGKADRRMHQSLFWSCLSAFLIAVCVALGGEHLLRLYTSDPIILGLAGACLWADVLLQPFKAANIVITNALRAAGDSRFPAIVGSSMMWTLGLATVLGLGFGLKLGVLGLWLGMAADEFYRAIANYLRWRGGKWQGKGVV
jgi:putative MATE family efflux protein